MPRDGLDLWRFERGLDEGERMLADGSRARRRGARRARSSEWRGAPLIDVAYAPFAQAAIVRLEELRASALELRIEAELALGRHARLIGELQGLVGEHPLRERLWAQLMTALYRDGRQADALAAYRAARERLIEEIGIEPGPELRALEARILAQDPALAVRGHADGAAGPCRAGRVHGRERARPRWPSGWRRPPGIEAVAVALVRDAGELAAAHRGAARRRRRARASPRSRATRPGEDAVRLAAEQDAAVLLLAAPEDGPIDPELATVLRAAACDVALVAGGAPRRRRARSSCRSPAARTTGRPRSSGPRWAAAR